MPFSLSGKTAIVTGGASGIGLAIAEAFGAAGADVHILDLAAPAISTAVEGCRRKGWKCTGHMCDVTVASRVNACFDAICTDGRRCDVLVNNAGIGAVGTVEQATDAEMDRCGQPWALRRAALSSVALNRAHTHARHTRQSDQSPPPAGCTKST